jgi:sulfate adenylyltransferase subunit 1
MDTIYGAVDGITAVFSNNCRGGIYQTIGRHTTQTARCIINEVKYKIDINSLHRNEDDKEIGLNDIGRILIKTTSPLFFDSYRRNRNTGSIILVDEATNETVAAGMII